MSIVTRIENGRQFRIIGETEPALANVCKKVLEGEIFIIPNLSKSPSSYWGQDRFNEYVDQVVRHASEVMDLRTHDLSADRMVEVWTTSEESDNWSDHGHPKIEGRFPDRFPAKWLEGLNEDDVLVLVGKKQRYFLVCRQTTHRYRRFGTFQEVLTKVNKDYVPKA